MRVFHTLQLASMAEGPIIQPLPTGDSYTPSGVNIDANNEQLETWPDLATIAAKTDERISAEAVWVKSPSKTNLFISRVQEKVL
jgi:hypothetical protein